MTWWNPFSWGGGAQPIAVQSMDPVAADAVALAALGGGGGSPSGSGADLSDFTRAASWQLGSLNVGDVLMLGTIGMGCRPDTPPQLVSMDVIDAIGWHPVVYFGESTTCAPATDPELYYVTSDGSEEGKRAVAETEAWLVPLLHSQRNPLLAQIARAFAYGTIPVVLDYGVRDLAIQIEQAQSPDELRTEKTPQLVAKPVKPKTRTKNLPGHVHYVRSHEVWPAECELQVQDDRLLALKHGEKVYGGEDHEDPGRVRAFLATWDPAFGRWIGQGSRRRVYKDWIEEGMARLWEIRYLERSVDLPRIGYAPEGDLTIGGQKVSAIKLLRAQIMSLRNGSAMVLPNTLLKDGSTRAFAVDVPQIPDRHSVFKAAIDTRRARMLTACMAPSELNKATEEAAMDAAQKVCDHVARTLTRIVNNVLRLRYGEAAPFVRVLANDIPKRKLRLVSEVFKAVASIQQHLPDGRVYTLGELVDPEILDQLGLRARSVEDAAHAPVAPTALGGEPGRKQDEGSDREGRRDDSKTLEGERDTGGDDQERDEQNT